jgi:hypothetical protein
MHVETGSHSHEKGADRHQVRGLVRLSMLIDPGHMKNHAEQGNPESCECDRYAHCLKPKGKQNESSTSETES